MGEDDPNFFLKDLMNVVLVDVVIFRQEFCCPGSVFLDFFVGSDILAFENVFLEKFQLFFQSRRKNCKSHNLDQTNVFFLDVMILSMRMINTKRMLLCCDIVSQCQVKFIHIADFTRDRSNRIMRLSICLCKNKCRFIGVSSPYFQHMSRKIHQTVRIFVADTKYR